MAKRRKLFVELCNSAEVELRLILKSAVGRHLGRSCALTSTSPIVGTAYTNGTHDLCAKGYSSLGEAQRLLYTAVPPLTEELVEERVELAMQLLRDLTDAHPPEWFVDDANFAAAMRTPMILKQQMALTLPQMPSLLGLRNPAIKRADVGSHQDVGWPADALGVMVAPNLQPQAAATPVAGLLAFQMVERVSRVGQPIERCERLLTVPRRDLYSASTLELLASTTLVLLRGMTALPDLARLSTLRVVDLSGSKQLHSIPESTCALPNLEKLWLSGCSRLAALPLTAQAAATAPVQELLLTACVNLSDLPESIGSLQQLRLLDLAHCTGLAALPGRLERLPALQQFIVVGCSALRDLSAGLLNACARCGELSLHGCASLRTHPEPPSGLRITSLPSHLREGGTSLFSQLFRRGATLRPSWPYALSEGGELEYLTYDGEPYGSWSWELLPAGVIADDRATDSQLQTAAARRARWGDAMLPPETRQRRRRRALARHMMRRGDGDRAGAMTASTEWPAPGFFAGSASFQLEPKLPQSPPPGFHGLYDVLFTSSVADWKPLGEHLTFKQLIKRGDFKDLAPSAPHTHPRQASRA